MSTFTKEEYGPKELPSEGKHEAVLYSIVDLGSRPDTYQGVTRVKHEIYICWELDEKMSDGRPFVAGKTYTATNGNFGIYFAPTSNIFKMLKGWTGLDEKACKKPSLLGKLLNNQVPATITIEHAVGKADSTKTYANIESIKPSKAKTKYERINDVLVYELGGDNLDKLPEWQREKVLTCMENNGGLPPREDHKPDPDPNNGAELSDLPF